MNARRHFIFLFLCLCAGRLRAQEASFETNDFRFTVDHSGYVTAFIDKRSATNYYAAQGRSPLLTLYKDSTYLKPVSAEWKPKGNQVSIRYANGSVAIVKIVPRDGYLRLSLQSLVPRNGVAAILWGPYATTIRQSIGETICVVHDSSFAVGMQSLGINTIEGLPDGNDNAWGGSFIDPLPGQQLPDSLRDQIGKSVSVNVNVTGDMPEYVRMYRGSAAVKTAYGSELRLFSRDRRIPRVVHNGGAPGNDLQFVDPVDVDFLGSAVALFGCPEPKVLDVIEKIEIGEKLPHPMLNGQWIKRSPVPGQAYLMFEGKDQNKGIEYAKNCGFKLIHMGDLFASWGHFGLETHRFPKGAADIKRVTDSAWQSGIALGVHTLTMFTGTNDAYVSPTPSDSLAKKGSTRLTKDANADQTDLLIADPTYFRSPSGTHTIKIGKELINYRDVSADQPWRLLDCKRGQFGTSKATHGINSVVDKLVNNDYQGFYPDIHLQDQYARRLAAVCNETGLGLMDFDGYGGESPTGHGAYGAARFIDLWYKSLKKYVLTCGAGTFHYYWHIYSFMNWGEPWYNSLRQSQVNYRIENQRYFNRNYMPHMLGWFSMGADYKPEEMEWIQARSAAFNAGYLLRVDETIEKNGFKEEIFDAVREWQRARNEKAFTPTQIVKLQDPKNEFHLKKTGQDSWQLIPVSLQSGYEHRFRPVQTGEPVASHFKINNPYGAQPVQLYITASAVDGNRSATVTGLKLEINNYQTLTIDEPIKAGDRIFSDGKAVFLCDATWNKIKKISVADIPQWVAGQNQIVVRSEFSGQDAPILKFDFKAVGSPEEVKK